MKPNLALVIHGKGDLRLTELPIPEAGPGETLLQIGYGGICGSDLHYWRHGAAGLSVLREPMVLGHEVVGTVLDGELPPGTEVAVHPASPAPDQAGTPYPQERPNLAPGGSYLGSAAQFPHTQGGFARYVALPTRMLRPLPPGLDLRTAALAEPAAVAWHAVGQAGDLRGRTVVVVGAGPIGSLIVAAAKAAGAAEITAVDLQARPLEIARAAGATKTLLAPGVEAAGNWHADVVFESSGHPAGLSLALNGAVRGGRVVLVGMLPAGEQPVPISLAVGRELELIGSFRFNGEIDRVLVALADRTLQADAVVTHTFPVAQALEAFDVAGDPARSGKVLLEF